MCFVLVASATAATSLIAAGSTSAAAAGAALALVRNFIASNLDRALHSVHSFQCIGALARMSASGPIGNHCQRSSWLKSFLKSAITSRQ